MRILVLKEHLAIKYKYDMLLSQLLFGENMRYKPKSANNLGKISKKVDIISALHENPSYLGQQTFLFLSECNSG